MNAYHRLFRDAVGLFAFALIAVTCESRIAAQPKQQQKQPAKTVFSADEVMAPMDHLGPQPRPVNMKGYSEVLRVGAGEQHKTVGAALDAIKDASAAKPFAILVAAGTYPESRIAMKQYVDVYGGFAPGNWKERNVYQNATVLDAQKKGPVVIGADNARIDGFVITGGEQKAHGGGIVCAGVSPTIVNNIIVGNNTIRMPIKEGLGKQIGNEGAGIALTAGSRSYIANNLIAENTTEVGNGAGISARGRVNAKILRNVFCNNISGAKDDQMFHGKVGSRSSPGGAISCAEESAPDISFNVVVRGAATLNNDGGGIWTEGNSMPRITYNWFVGNTSGDDGGGIYVMGNLYYDDEGKRFDLVPDGPVSIEGNFIAGNTTDRGGPGGIRISRFGRADLRRNRIIANEKGGAHGAEGGVISMLEDNIMEDNGAKREPAKPKFRLTGDITARKFDARSFVTEIKTGAPIAKENLAGCVVRIGKEWSVVKSSGLDGLVVWGKFTDEAPKFEILDSYVPKHAE